MMGFTLSDGEQFVQKYGKASKDPKALGKILSEILEPRVLGGAIFAKYYYLKQWSEDSEDKLDEKTKQWFKLACQRLKKIAGSELRFFKGTLARISLTSSNQGFGPVPAPGTECEQRLFIKNDGKVTYNVYAYNQKQEKARARGQRFKLTPDKSHALMSAFTDYFSEGYQQQMVTDIGTWELILTNTDGQDFYFDGSVCCHLIGEQGDLSKILLNSLDRSELYAFDNDGKPEPAETIRAEYTHEIFGADGDKIHKETLVIKKTDGTLEYTCDDGAGKRVAMNYYLPVDVDGLLSDISGDGKFWFELLGRDVPGGLREQSLNQEFTVKLGFKHQPDRTYNGIFSLENLPSGWSVFAEHMKEIMSKYFAADLFNHDLYDPTRAKEDEYIFCSVTFSDQGQSYYYLTDDENLKVGDTVWVPVGDDEHKIKARIVKIEHFTAQNAPRDIETTKYIEALPK